MVTARYHVTKNGCSAKHTISLISVEYAFAIFDAVFFYFLFLFWVRLRLHILRDASSKL